MEVKHCNTDEMTSDYISKPLVGAKFYKFKNQIMNLPGTIQDSDAKTDTVTTCDSSKDKQMEQFFQINTKWQCRVHFCQLHALVYHWQSSTMSEQQESNNNPNYELKNGIQQLPRDLQINVEKSVVCNSNLT